MPRALGSSSNKTETIPSGGSHSLPSTSLVHQNLIDSLPQDNEAPFIFWIHLDKRFDSIENNTPLRILVPTPILLPRGTANPQRDRASEANVNMDKNDQVSSTTATSLQANPQRNPGSHLPDYTSSGFNISRRQRKRGGGRNKVVEDFSDLSAWIPNGSIASSSTDQTKNVNESNKAVKRNSKKKGKKKKKQQKKSTNSDEVVAPESKVHSVLEQITEHVAYDLNEEVGEFYQNNDISSEAYSDAHSTLFTESISDEWISYDSTNAGDDVEEQTPIKEENSFYPSMPSEPSEYANSSYLLDSPGKRCVSSGTSLKDSGHKNKFGERTKWGNRDSSINDLHSSLPRKIDGQDSQPVQNSQVCEDERKAVASVCHVVSDRNGKAVNKPPLVLASEQVDRTHLLGVRPQNCEDERKEVASVCPTVSDGNSKAVYNPPPFLASELVDKTHSFGVQSQKEIPLLVSDTSTKKEEEVSRSVRKWMPVPRKDTSRDIHTTSSNIVLVSYPEVSIAKEFNLKNNGRKLLNPNAHCFVPLKNVGVASVGSTSAVLIRPPPKVGSQVEKLSIKNRFITEEQSNKPSRILEIYSNKITQAVNEAYRVEIASTGAHLATGSPLADFETLLYSASPVLRQTGRLQDCRPCSKNHFVDASLCRHEIPNIYLGSLWQWYEKSGSFGLEVRVEDHQRMGMKPCKFSAYFVPLLSAVQLFGTSNCNRELVKVSDISHPPIGSVHVPQPRGMNETSSSLNTNTASGQAEFSDQSLKAAQIDDSELLFEYFDSEKPYHRQPLFEKIKDLVRDNGLPNGQAYGDPKMLVSMNLQDLHPASWYSVAWYPIYRIPGGKLQAAFLTYHSLGHFVHRRTLSSFSGGGTNIVSPVVGLQSYKAQSECWLQLRPSLVNQSKETYKLNKAEILKERLRSLEKTACVMSRTIVNKGICNAVNRHPDYEFFVTRRP